ncbi:MAG TPA: hypothetical protein VFF64_22380 [Candidatus Eremiobacteraceae bacterium]|nr:hypothetical protein [Candidatus Eremiobacteraceae bacterium]
MRTFLCVLLLSGGSLLAQGTTPSKPSQHDSKKTKDQITVQGCVGRFSGDYVLTKQDPGVTYELQATGKVKLRHYLGQRVEVTGTEGPTMATSSDALTKTGSAAPVTLTITSIKTIDKECTSH